jgi:acyl-CoA synthetase (AMP-forming)/AMP-acid ligase II
MPADPNLVRHLVRLAAEQGDALAVVEPGGDRVTFGELDRRTARFAGGLRALGLGAGDRILVLAPMGIPLYVALLGVFRAGCTAVLVDPSAPRALLRATLASLGLAGFVGSPKAQLLRLLIPELRGLGLYVSTGFVPLPHRGLAGLRGEPLEPQPAEAPALITFTTGTSGRARAMARRHSFLDAQREALTEHMGLASGDIDLATLPVFLLNSLSAGATCVLADADLSRVGSADPERIARQLRDWEVTTTSGSPAFFAPLARALEARGERLPALRKLFVGGGRVPSRLLEQLAGVAPQAEVVVHYGSTEADPVTSIEAREVLALGGDGAGRGSCVGRPGPGLALELWRPGTSEPAAPGEPGEVVVSGDYVNRSYFRDPEADARYKVERDGRTWHRTGDVARWDEAGRLWLLGRVGEAVEGRWPLVVEALAESAPWVRRAGLGARDGRAVLVVELDPSAPEDWRAQLASRCEVGEVLGGSVPVDHRHNAKVDRPALARLLEDARGSRPRR